MIRVQIAIQHDPRRSETLASLLAQLGPHGNARVVVDPGFEEPTRSPWRCYRACLESLRPDASHLLVLQDDAELCRDFPRALETVIAAKSSAPIALFVSGFGRNGRAILDACYRERRWAELVPGEYVPAVATVWPRDHVGRMLGFVDRKKFPASRRADDGIIGAYCAEERVTVWAPVPSLVEHRDVVPSLVGTAHFAGRNPARIAACWLGDEMSPFEFDW